MQPPARIPLGIVHGRFQPPHNGHLRYLLAALERADQIIIGVSTPTLCSEEEALRTGYPCTAALNPFSYEERVQLLTAALEAEGVPAERYSFCLLSSDYAGLADVVPKEAVFLMSVTGEGDEKKMVYLASLGYATEVVLRVPAGQEREQAEAVRESVRAGTDEWKSIVPTAIATTMANEGLIQKLR